MVVLPAGTVNRYWTTGSALTTIGWGSKVIWLTFEASDLGIASVKVVSNGADVGFVKDSVPRNSLPLRPSSSHERATVAPSGVVIGSNLSWAFPLATTAAWSEPPPLVITKPTATMATIAAIAAAINQAVRRRGAGSE